MFRCPKCNSKNINTSINKHGKPDGYMWCADCYYNIDNTINPCPFKTPTRNQLAEEGLKSAAGGKTL